MINLGAYSITMVLLLGGLIGLALLLSRYRDRLHSRFGARFPFSRANLEIAPGVRIMVVEIDGMTVVCGLNKTGICALQVVTDKSSGSVA